ncbi:MAG: hypothetical protein A2Z12_09415 [Actinobacteria bacterium RBG_16_68_21]|nr:MAG: hypothetical protein A2Z12_09415 [Actinobacteria bacterium RBG_16_68_21]
MRRLLKFVFSFFLVGTAMWAVGQLLSRNFEGDSDPDADEFRVGAIVGGRQITSRAKALRLVSARVVMGGVDLDLREATLDPNGGHVALNVAAGGVRIAVPPTWMVVVADDVVGGTVDVDTTPPEDLPPDAPVLTVEATVRSGGVMIEAGELQQA